MRVLKFGGTSMGDEHTWRQVLEIINQYEAPIIVVSATARTTRQLVAAAKLATDKPGEANQIVEKIHERHLSLISNFLAHPKATNAKDANRQCTQWINQCINKLQDLLQQINEQEAVSAQLNDAVSSIGEQLSAWLFACCGRAYGLSTLWVDATNVIKTDSSFGQAVPDNRGIQSNINLLSNISDQGEIPVMGGFYGEDKSGHITTLGFEGSDYTASLIGTALEAETIEIWTDVSGIYTCDPRVVKDARPIPELSFQEATDLAYFGAKVLHPSTMKPASTAEIPVLVKNIFDPDHPGTKIHGQQTNNGLAKALTYLDDITIITVTGKTEQEGYQFLANVFQVLNDAKLPVNAVTTTEASVSVALQDSPRHNKLQTSLEAYGAVSVQNKQGLISLIGCDFQNAATIQDHVLSAIADIKPALISYSESKQNLNIALSETVLIPAVCKIHDLLFGDNS